MSCVVKPHYTCDGTGQMCDRCGESEEACGCEDDDEEPDFVKCEECDGAGRICVTHESPCGDLKSPPQCDKAQAEASPQANSREALSSVSVPTESVTGLSRSAASGDVHREHHGRGTVALSLNH